MVVLKIVYAVLLLPIRLVALIIHLSEQAHAEAVAAAQVFDE